MNYPSRQLLHQFGRLFQAITAQSGCLSLATFLLTCTPDSDKTTPLGVITGTSIAGLHDFRLSDRVLLSFTDMLCSRATQCLGHLGLVQPTSYSFATSDNLLPHNERVC